MHGHVCLYFEKSKSTELYENPPQTKEKKRGRVMTLLVLNTPLI